MEGLFFIVIALIEVIAIVDVLRVAMAGFKKILWILLILCVPVLGIIFYYLLGRPERHSQQTNAPSSQP